MRSEPHADRRIPVARLRYRPFLGHVAAELIVDAASVLDRRSK